MAERLDSRQRNGSARGSSQYLLIVRHGKANRVEEINEVAESLRKLLWELPESQAITIGRVHFAPQPYDEEAKLTAETIGRAVDVEATEAPPELTIGPERLSSWSDRPQVDEAIRSTVTALEKRFAKMKETNALVLVGNSPAVDWLVTGLCHKRLALARSEMLCLSRASEGANWRAAWALTPGTLDKTQDLQSKVASKMVVITVLAGFVGATLGQLLLDIPADRGRPLALGAASAFALSLTLLIGTLFAYDRLGMPARFWASVRPRRRAGLFRTPLLNRPPSSSAWVVYQHSVRLWRWVAVALAIAALGVVMMAVALISSPDDQAAWVIILVASLIALCGAAWWWRAAPRLGSED